MLCRRKRDSSLVVVKELYQQEMTEEDRRASMNEIRVLSMLRHPNIIAYYDSFTVDSEGLREDNILNAGSLMIVMEYADGGTLHDFISQQQLYLSEREVLRLFSQVALALHHVHGHNILHRDLKTANILISGSDNCKILKLGDFGISKVLSSKSKAETIVGTPSYLSPELCEGKPYDKKSDVWALGCVLAEIACLRKLFDASNLPALVLKIMRGTHEPIPGQYSERLHTLIKSMVNGNPLRRPDMNEIISQPFLQEHIIDAQMSIGRVNPRSFDNNISASSFLSQQSNLTPA